MHIYLVANKYAKGICHIIKQNQILIIENIRIPSAKLSVTAKQIEAIVAVIVINVMLTQDSQSLLHIGTMFVLFFYVFKYKNNFRKFCFMCLCVRVCVCVYVFQNSKNQKIYF